MGKYLAAFFIAQISVFLAVVASAQDAAGDDGDVVIVKSCAATAGEQSEEMLVAALRMAFDDAAILEEVIVSSSLMMLPMDRQLEALEAAVNGRRDRAMIWCACEPGPPFSVKVLVSSPGGRTVRTVAAGSAQEAALAVKEMVDDSFRPALPVEEPEPEPEPCPPPVDEKGPLGLVGRVSPGGVPGAGFVFRGGASLHVDISGGLFFRAGVYGGSGPYRRERELSFVARGVEPRLEIGYVFSVESVRIGAVLSAAPTRWYADLALDGTYSRRHDWWGFRGTAGAELRIGLTERLFAVVIPAVGISSTKRFYRVSDGSTLVELSALDLSCGLGLLVML